MSNSISNSKGTNDEDKEVITIIGKKEGVEEARTQLEAIIKNIDNIVEDEISVDPKFHKHFVARRGEVLHRIAEECGGVMISFPRSGVDSDRVTLKGAKDCIDAAKARMLEIVEDLEQMVTIECIIPARHHRIVMGKGGSKVQGVTSEFDVNIKFPERDAQEAIAEGYQNGDVNGGDPIMTTDIIRISGRKEKCDKAKAALLALVPITEEINVAFDLHRSLIGQKGRDVKELMNTYDVHIELSPQDQKLDIIKVTGARANIEEAKIAIDKRIVELEADRKDRELRSFEVKVEIDPEFHPKIIGRRGAVVNKIRANHSVQISFPKVDDPVNNIISIQGYEANAYAARDEILGIVNELNSMHREEVSIDERVHRRFIGFKGRRVREIKEMFKVEISFPRPEDPDQSIIVISGSHQDDVEACRDHLLNLEEEFLQDVVTAAPTQQTTFTQILEDIGNQRETPKQGFVVQGAPWERRNNAPNTQSQEDFPDFGLGGPAPVEQAPSAPIASAWNARH